jgi:hypothetical protein
MEDSCRDFGFGDEYGEQPGRIALTEEVPPGDHAAAQRATCLQSIHSAIIVFPRRRLVKRLEAERSSQIHQLPILLAAELLALHSRLFSYIIMMISNE